MAERIIYASPSVKEPSGGVRILYQHVKMLTDAGHEASIWHCDSSHSVDWFPSDVDVITGPKLDLDESDLLVIPEGFVLSNADPAPGCRKAIFNQNHFYTFAAVQPEDYPRWDPPPGIWVASWASYKIMSRLQRYLDIPSIDHIPCAIDTRLFRPASHRERKVTWMPRKRPNEAALLHALLLADDRMADVHLKAIDGMSEEQAARELGTASVFVALGRDEGFGLPVAEALSAGCVVVGYPGGGGAELFEAPGTLAIDDSDVLQLVDAVAEALLNSPTPATRTNYRRWVQARYTLSRLMKNLTKAIQTVRQYPASAGTAAHPWPDVLRIHGYL